MTFWSMTSIAGFSRRRPSSGRRRRSPRGPGWPCRCPRWRKRGRGCRCPVRRTSAPAGPAGSVSARSASPGPGRGPRPPRTPPPWPKAAEQLRTADARADRAATKARETVAQDAGQRISLRAPSAWPAASLDGARSRQFPRTQGPERAIKHEDPEVHREDPQFA